MTVRAKFTVTGIDTHQYGPEEQYKQTKVVLEPRYDDTIEEDRRFCKATPSGKMEMQIDNATALAEFVVGREFYVDFTPA